MKRSVTLDPVVLCHECSSPHQPLPAYLTLEALLKEDAEERLAIVDLARDG